MEIKAAPQTGGVTDDRFLGDALSVLQPARGYRAGLDAVLLAASAPRQASQEEIEILDVGAGVGVVGLCLAQRLPRARITLVERDSALVSLAQQNVTRNGLAGRMETINADVTRALSATPELKVRAETFDLVVSNPPYHDAAAGTPAPDQGKAAAHAMPTALLDRWVQFMASMTRPGGSFALVHRAQALPELLSACRSRFGALCVLPLHPREGAPAIRVIVTGIRGSRAPLTLAAGLVLHAPEGGFTPAVEAALRRGAALR